MLWNVRGVVMPARRYIEDNGINAVAVVKGDERYVFLFDDQRRTEVLRTAGRWAANQELSFSWYDAYTISARLRTMKGEQ